MEVLARARSKLTVSRVTDAKSRWGAHSTVKDASKVGNDLNKALMTVSWEVVGATKRKVSIIGLKLKDALNWVSTQVQMLSQVATSRMCTKLGRVDSEAFRNVAAFWAVLHNRRAKADRNLLEMTVAVAGFNGNIVVAEPGQTEEVKSNQTYQVSTKTGDTGKQ